MTYLTSLTCICRKLRPAVSQNKLHTFLYTNIQAVSGETVPNLLNICHVAGSPGGGERLPDVLFELCGK